ncbi:MAG TPA: DUF3014 domain-containing protein [Burkholderiales bacterium]|nr:DUF3014 domain-containing protein [Burkholderiales bacterium]
MEQWSARDDSPYVRPPEPSSSPWWLWVLMIVLLGAGAGYYFWQQDQPLMSQQPEPIAAPEPPAAAPQEEEPVVRYPVPAPAPAPEGAAAKPLPTLENSDPMMRESASGLVGRKAFDALVRPTQLIRNVVATVDNLPRETAPTRVMPVEPVPGRFVPGPKNQARYAPYVRVLESLDTRALVQRYVDAYPLFQQAYAELGFPNRHFNDRLVEAIDNLLAAPELAEPPQLIQPKVLYEYADEDLQNRSAGQKIMMRMGADNARRVKAKLREIRRELLAQR